jgi:hypothetical protein
MSQEIGNNPMDKPAVADGRTMLNRYVTQDRVVKHSVFGKQKTDRPGRRMHHTFEQRQESARAYF